MGTSIKASFESLESASSAVRKKSKAYSDAFGELKGIASDILEVNWIGIDSTEFVEAVKSFEQEIKKMESLMNEYSTYLNEVKVEYVATQDALAKEARDLNRNK